MPTGIVRVILLFRRTKMANMETKNLRIPPSEEDETISLMQRYGWQLFSSNEIHSKDSHEELRGETVYSVTETTHFIKLVFQRDKSDPKYADFVALETLDSKLAEIKEPFRWQEDKVGGGAKWFFIAAVVSFIISLIASNGYIIIGSILLLIGGIVFIVLRLKSYPKRNEEHQKYLDSKQKEYEEKRSPLLAEISALEAKLNK